MLELPDDFDWTIENLRRLMENQEEKQGTAGGADVEAERSDVTSDATSDETFKEDNKKVEVSNAINTGAKSEVEGGQSDKERPPSITNGHGSDSSGGIDSTRGSTGTITVTTVSPTSADTSPSQPEPRPTTGAAKRRGPKFKNHSRRRAEAK